jgi:3-deoxy-manno-octulosonate cytidylyltransferase (CMP-KDO synthetase)
VSQLGVVCAIPSRLGSTRLPRKVLANLGGRPLLWHVWDRARRAASVGALYVLTDSVEVRDVASGWGAQVMMTSPDCQSGTARIASVIGQLEAPLVVNVQADECLLDPALVDQLVRRWEERPTDVITPVYPIRATAELEEPGVVKVARSATGDALYFSRSPVPHLRGWPLSEWLERTTLWGHVGVYGYSRRVLERYHALPPSQLEESEQVEQLRLLEAGYRCQTFETDYRPFAVDTPADLAKAAAALGGIGR